MCTECIEKADERHTHMTDKLTNMPRLGSWKYFQWSPREKRTGTRLFFNYSVTDLCVVYGMQIKDFQTSVTLYSISRLHTLCLGFHI